MKKTIEEWLKELDEPYRSQALKNNEIDYVKVDSLKEALFGAFDWTNSK